MKTKYLLVPFILGLGLALALAVDALFLLPKINMVQAATIEADSAGVVYASPGETFDEASPCHESITFVIRYDSESPSPELMAALADLQAAHRVSVVDTQTMPGTILVRGEEAALLALRSMPGVVMVYPADTLPVVAEPATDFACFEDGTTTFRTTDSRTINTPTSPTADGVITGVVTAEDTGLPLEGVYVNIYPADSYYSAGYDYTDGSGIFSLGGLDTGNYKLHFVEWDQYAFEWYNNKLDRDSADLIAVTDGMTTSISIQLARGGVITGVVTAEDTGLPLNNIDVWAYFIGHASSYGINTDASGHYDIGGLAAGAYSVCFKDRDYNYAAECYDNEPYKYGDGDPLDVTAGITRTNINAILSPAAVITGTVTASDSGDPLSNVKVSVYDPANSWWPIETDTTDASGMYHVRGLSTGDYKVKFTDDTGAYLSEYYNDQVDFNSADLVSVTGGTTTTVDAALTLGGRIAGRVVDADTGTGVANVSVSASRQDGAGPSGSATTGAGGYYTTSAMLSGVYRVSFDPPAPYFEERYDNFNSWGSFTPVVVNAPATTLGINAALTKGYMVTGTVTGAGTPLADVQVRPYRGSASYYFGSLSDYTAGDGTYVVGPLEPEDYRLAFIPPADSPYALQWYDGSYTYAGSTVITMPHTSPVNAELSYGSRITGVVTGPDGLQLSGVYINIYEAGASRTNLASVRTDENGQYLSPSLAPGTYQVNFNPPWGRRYAVQWYDGQSTQTDATVITVTTGVTITDINAQLVELPGTEATGTITGTVTAADTGQLVGLTACLYQDNPEQMLCGGWAQDGEFTISGWAAGQYHLYFDAPAPYAPVFYKDAYIPENATPITITGNMTTTNINQVLQIGGNITGTVTAAGSGVGVAGTKVEVRLADSNQVMGGPGSWSAFKTRTTYAGADGAYQMDGLPTGTYNVEFIPPAPYISQGYGSIARGFAMQNDYSVAGTSVSVVLGEVTPNINASLVEGGVITGVITAADIGEPFLNAAAVVYNTADEEVVSISANMDGHYTTPGLPAGEYKVKFSNGSDYLSEWNGNATSFETAAAITVPATGTVAGVNAALDKGGSFSGFTYNRETGLPLPWVSVEFYDASNSTYKGWGYGNGWGFYQATGLSAGQYKVSFTRSGYSTQWYSHATNFDSAIPVVVNLSQDTPNINGYLSSLMHNVYLPLVLRSH